MVTTSGDPGALKHARVVMMRSGESDPLCGASVDPGAITPTDPPAGSCDPTGDSESFVAMNEVTMQ
jgi:hypothetical protein